MRRKRQDLRVSNRSTSSNSTGIKSLLQAIDSRVQCHHHYIEEPQDRSKKTDKILISIELPREGNRVSTRSYPTSEKVSGARIERIRNQIRCKVQNRRHPTTRIDSPTTTTESTVESTPLQNRIEYRMQAAESSKEVAATAEAMTTIAGEATTEVEKQHRNWFCWRSVL